MGPLDFDTAAFFTERKAGGENRRLWGFGTTPRICVVQLRPQLCCVGRCACLSTDRVDEKLAARDERCSSERRPWEKKGCADGGGIDSECSRTRNLARVSCRCVSCLLELMKRETREAAEKPPRWGATWKPPASVLALIQSSSEVFIFMCVFRFELQYAVSAFGAVRWAQAVPPSMGRRGQRVGTRGRAPSRLPPFAYDSTIVTPSLMQGVWTVSQRTSCVHFES